MLRIIGMGSAPAARRLVFGLMLAVGIPGVIGVTATKTNRSIRVRIAPEAIRHEHGCCYIAAMDFGEDGDKETGNRSQLELYENGRRLGPAHALHRDIREKGKGRYSHWGRNQLYFSASDNSDPSANGRVYEVASPNPESVLGGAERFAGPPKTHVEVVKTPRHAYTVRVGGDVDAGNSPTRTHAGISIVFQPNLSLTIANTGRTAVRNPWLTANGRGNWDTLEHMAAEFVRDARTAQERALFVWQAMRENRYHCVPLFADNEFHDPVKLYNSYGFALCDDAGACATVLWAAAGLGPPYASPPRLRHLHGHVQGEVQVEGRWQFLDVDQDVFFLDRENRRPVSGDEAAWDHDLARREIPYGPVFGDWAAADSNASLFGVDDVLGASGVAGHTMHYALRPGEKIEFRWDNRGKWACQKPEYSRRPPFFGNSMFVYAPPLDAQRLWRKGAYEPRDIIDAPGPGGGCAGAGPGASVSWRFRYPWVMCGGRIRAEFEGESARDGFAIDVQPGGGKTMRVWQAMGAGVHRVDAAIDSALAPHVAPAKYEYLVTVHLESRTRAGSARLRRVRFETDVMASPLSLPGLRRGLNHLEFRSDTRGAHEVTITHVWRECRGLHPPAPPVLESPVSDATVASTFVPFRWRPVKGCRAYHFQVSTRPDFRVPWRPSFDIIINRTDWTVPKRGMFSPGTAYCWRVRARSISGIWSRWSGMRTFQWSGPCVPLDVHREFTPEGIVLRWAPNSRGTRPRAYDVYGSDEKGFPVHKQPYIAYRRGKASANFVVRTTKTQVLVVGPGLTGAPNRNRCWYRVVAVDARGVESVPSAQVEMPHPFFWSHPPQKTAAGRPVTYVPGVLCSIGDIQYKYKSMPKNAGGRESLRFRLVEGPDWLRLDPTTGRLTGTPPAPGHARVRIRVDTGLGRSAEQAFQLEITPSD